MLYGANTQSAVAIGSYDTILFNFECRLLDFTMNPPDLNDEHVRSQTILRTLSPLSSTSFSKSRYAGKRLSIPPNNPRPTTENCGSIAALSDSARRKDRSLFREREVCRPAFPHRRALALGPLLSFRLFLLAREKLISLLAVDRSVELEVWGGRERRVRGEVTIIYLLAQIPVADAQYHSHRRGPLGSTECTPFWQVCLSLSFSWFDDRDDSV